jgi:hypothetical protein
MAMPSSPMICICRPTRDGTLKQAEPLASTGTVPSTFLGISTGTVALSEARLARGCTPNALTRIALIEPGLIRPLGSLRV